MLRLASFATLLTACLATGVKRQEDVVSADLVQIASSVTVLNSFIQNLPATGVPAIETALSIHDGSTLLATAIAAAATAAASSGPFSEAQGAAIIGIVEEFTPTITEALTGIVAQMGVIADIPIQSLTALVKEDLASLQAATKSFENELVADSPADLLPTATLLTSSIDNAFATAQAAYAGA
ncbi:hypothetical protein BDP27DRAFT_1312820 [Rhodocollybia butyracea]|uniref:Uncharacterized protein n=1 Tax=Rhodocollybia butyracea TaxID=206335 RepID=A0A9P5Q8L8_9AGAR|nr:hypothetical protein BDP27DRAFT_1312820 [Rhodocollybia butyracea]